MNPSNSVVQCLLTVISVIPLDCIGWVWVGLCVQQKKMKENIIVYILLFVKCF